MSDYIDPSTPVFADMDSSLFDFDNAAGFDDFYGQLTANAAGTPKAYEALPSLEMNEQYDSTWLSTDDVRGSLDLPDLVQAGHDIAMDTFDANSLNGPGYFPWASGIAPQQLMLDDTNSLAETSNFKFHGLDTTGPLPLLVDDTPEYPTMSDTNNMDKLLGNIYDNPFIDSSSPAWHQPEMESHGFTTFQTSCQGFLDTGAMPAPSFAPPAFSVGGMSVQPFSDHSQLQAAAAQPQFDSHALDVNHMAASSPAAVSDDGQRITPHAYQGDLPLAPDNM